MTAATPETWKLLMDRAGIASIRKLAAAAGIDHTIVNRVIMKGSNTNAENMEKMAGALRVPVEQLYELSSGVAATPLALPKGTEKLTERQKTAVTEMIRTLVESREYAPEFVDKKSAEPTQPGQEKTGSVTPIGGYK